MLRSQILLLVLLTPASICVAETHHDPIEFTAGITAFAELCAARYPAMKDAPEKLLQGMRDADRAFVAQLKQSPAFQPALAKARVEILRLPPEKLLSECEALYR